MLQDVRNHLTREQDSRKNQAAEFPVFELFLNPLPDYMGATGHRCVPPALQLRVRFRLTTFPVSTGMAASVLDTDSRKHGAHFPFLPVVAFR